MKDKRHELSVEEENRIKVLSEKHIKLVDGLKKALILGQVGFLKAGEILSDIKESKTYEAEDLTFKWNFEQFCTRPDLPIPGRNTESKRQTAYSLIRIYKVFKEKLGTKEEKLAGIGWSKLDMIAPLVEKAATKEEADDWIQTAETLTVPALRAQIMGKNPAIGAGLDCKHEDGLWSITKCKKCGYILKKEELDPKDVIK